MIHSSTGGDIKSTTSKVNVPWPPSVSGTGATVIGTVVEIRNHSVQDSSGKHHRHVAVVLDVEYFKVRRFNEKGEEIEATGPTDKATPKGFINKFGIHIFQSSSLQDRKEIADPDEITVDKYFNEVLGGNSMPYSNENNSLHPKVKGRFEYWGLATQLKTMEIKKGEKLRLKTRGNSIIVDSCASLKPTSQNYSGENVIGGWTSKIQVAQKEEQKVPVPGEDKEGVDPSEWD